MKIIQKRIYEGKNIYSHKKCIRIDVDLEGPNRCRKVNIRSIEWLIYNGVKYVVE